ncbi:hypothetical protein FRACYDRAFT_267554 [Fragilariopsis cylindrus CCMP1102]|uniref:Uncharacterized protein n=1 Tax=Fragilariopsis cylindrus CCMP1102 TaxID=635003 RepID=A0A1E7FZJ7_9STRA|nr:hypothetical protein FRACYDRAFT_267554 [Fragilariopsis cylindrus CCMP1102]|eukprot:OEU23534.1 hypothetical protein FRACYDRAFT_267554 [Fragilariopsis cylindrus CCMP1102]
MNFSLNLLVVILSVLSVVTNALPDGFRGNNIEDGSSAVVDENEISNLRILKPRNGLREKKTKKTKAPTVKKTKAPTVKKTKAPTETKAPTVKKTKAPTETKAPTVKKTKAPTVKKTKAPKVKKTKAPTIKKTKAPSETKSPSQMMMMMKKKSSDTDRALGSDESELGDVIA